MKRVITCLSVLLTLISITNGQTVESWTQLGSFSGIGRMGAVSFELSGYGYVGTGKSSDGVYRRDFWRYNPATDTWTQKKDVGGIGRYLAIGFSIGTKGYIGCGNIGTDQALIPANDFLEYDPQTDDWTIRPNIGASGRIGSVAFAVNGKGYVTTGFLNPNQYDNSTYEYDPAGDGGRGLWTQKQNFPGGARYGAGGFGVSGNGYVIGGEFYDASQPPQNNYLNYKQTWLFNTSTGNWTLINNTSPPSFLNRTTAFVVGNKAYAFGEPLLGGSNCWKFDPNTNAWSPKLNYPYSMVYPSAFSICGKGYVTADHFSTSVFKYVDPIGLEGPEVVCSTASYTAPSVVSWSTSNSTILTIDQQGVATRVGTSSGSVVITATQCSGYLQKTVWVGSPAANGSTLIYVGTQRGIDPVTLSPGSTYQFNCDLVPFADTYTWGIPARSGFTISSGQGTAHPFITTGPTAGTYTFTCKVTNSCGFNYTHNLTVIIQSGGGGQMMTIRAFPNPASSQLFVQVSDSTSTSGESLTSDYYVVIRDKNANSVFQAVTCKKELQIPTDGLPSDNYFLRIIYKEAVFERQIIVKH